MVATGSSGVDGDDDSALVSEGEGGGAVKEVHLDVVGLLVAGEMISELERILKEQKIDKISSFYPEGSKRSTKIHRKTSMRTFLDKFQTVLQLLNLSNLQHCCLLALS